VRSHLTQDRCCASPEIALAFQQMSLIGNEWCINEAIANENEGIWILSEVGNLSKSYLHNQSLKHADNNVV
jgi:hypothetical protein